MKAGFDSYLGQRYETVQLNVFVRCDALFGTMTG